MNARDYTADGVQFEYRPPAHVRALAPSAGPAEGGALVGVTGSGFSHRAALLGALACRFNRSAAAAAWRGASALHCVAPAHGAGVVGVEVTQNGQQHTASGVQFEYRHAVAHGVHPRGGPARGGSLLEVRGAGGHAAGTRGAVWCRFGAADAVSATHAGTELAARCVAPPAADALLGPAAAAGAGAGAGAGRGASGVVPVRVLCDGAVQGGGAAFAYRPASVVHAVQPEAGARGGGTLVTVRGTGFFADAAAARCRFGESAVPARRVARGVLECVAPRAGAPGYAAVEVAMNARDYTADGVQFEYLTPPSLLWLHPTSGATVDSLLVIVAGTSFSVRASRLSLSVCSVNASLFAATASTSELLECRVALRNPGLAAFDVANAPPDFSHSGQFILAYTPSVNGISPLSGPTAGGTVVTFTGSSFSPFLSSGAFCKIGSHLSPLVFISSDTMVCTSSGELRPTSSYITLLCDGVQLPTGFAFAYRSAPTIDSIKPRLGPVTGGTIVTLAGHGFEANRASQCYFGLVRSIAFFVSANQLLCVSPARQAVGMVDIRVAMDASHQLSERFEFAVEPEQHLFSLKPTVGPPSGGTTVLAHGRHFSLKAWQLGLLACRFNQTLVRGQHLSSTSVACSSPPHDAGSVSVELTSNQQQYTGVGLLFQFAVMTLRAIRPSTGPLHGGTSVMIRIVGPVPPSSSRLVCHFGINRTVRGALCFRRRRVPDIQCPPALPQVPAFVQVLGLVSCVTPPAQPGPVATWITHLGVKIQHQLQFEYHVEPVITHSFPLMGPGRGGTIISVYGYDLPATLRWCRFSQWGRGNGTMVTSQKLVLARRRSSNMLECISPQASTGLARVDLSLGDKSCFSASSITYEFHPRIIIAVAVPSKGGTIGQLPVRVYGVGISRRASRLQHLRCKFGNLTTRARLEPSGSEVECKTPPGRPGFVPLELTNNLIDYSRSNQVFEYEMVLLAGIAPNKGPTSGGTAVTIAGAGLLSFAHFDTWCTFGTAEATLVNFLSSTSVSCTSPSMTAAGPVSVGLHAGGMATLEAVTFNFVQAIAVVSLHPLMGPTRGGTTVLVDGLYFSASSWCRFDTSLVPARFLSSTRLQCESPAHAAGVAKVAISSNGVDFSASELRYEYLVPAVLLSAFPDSGPTDGGTFVTLRGDFFSERAASLLYLHCRFNLTMVPAAFVSTRSVTCYTMEMGSGIASVATTNNLRDYTEGVVFRYHMVRMTRARPLSGPTLGGTRVHITGGPFNVGDVLCHFGTHATGGRSLSASSIICTSPAKGLGPGPVTLRITSAEATYTSTLTFAYMGEHHVRRLSPRAGPTAGGTTVMLQGVGISPSGALCKFDGTALLPRRLSHERIGCISPRSLAPTLTSVRVSGQDDGVRAWDEAVVFMVAPAASVARLQPTLGPVGGGTVVLLIGRFPFSTMSETAAFCNFNRTIVPGTIVLPTLVRCRTPVVLVPGYVGVEVTGNLLDFSHGGLLFSYEPVQLLALSPSSGPSHGQTRVFLSGYGLLVMRGVLSRALMCDFEGIVQPATLQDSSTVSCFAPAQHEYSHVAVRLLAEDCNSALPSGIQYTYYDGPSGSSLLPILGPTTAGTTVQVIGSHMKAAGQLFCKFQSVATSAAHVVVAVWQSKSRVDCVSPVMPLSGQAWVEVSSNGQNFSSSKLVFEYHLPISITSVRPSQAPVEGGMLLTIRGRHFSQRGSIMGSLRCNFGWTVREASFESSTALLCRSPPSGAGFQAVEVSNNALDFTNDRQGLEFIRISLVRLFPTAGPTGGGTTITLKGGAFPPGEYMCQFNGLERLAARISSSVLRCNAPPMRFSSQQQAAVRLRFNNVTLSAITSFLFYRPPRLLGLHPPAGPERGGTMLTLVGQSLEASTLAWCKFAHYGNTGQSLALVVPAHRVSSFQLGCVTPMASSLGPHLVELSFNDQQYTASQHLFTYQSPLLLRRLFPAKGPTRGNTLVRVSIHGADSIDGGAKLACMFNSTMVHASLHAVDSVQCRAPSHSSGVVLVGLLANRVPMVSTPLEFEFQTLSILRLRPSYGPVSGGTRVVVQGAHLPVGRIKCRFGASSGFGEAESTDTLGCVSPPYSASNVVQLDFESAGQSLVNGLDFRFHDDGEVAARLLPQVGPLDGGTLVRIAVRNLYIGHSEGLLCRFGADGTVPALWVAQDEVQCVAPAVRRAQSVLVVVSAVTAGFHSSTAGVFVYERPWRPTSVVPTKGGVQGGTMLNVTGTRFPLRFAVVGQLVCNVNNAVVAATRHSLQLLSCRAPSHAAGHVTVEVTGSLRGLLFEYVLVGPADVNTASSPVAGSTLIQLRTGSSSVNPIAATSPLECTGARLLVCQARTALEAPTSISSSGALLAKEVIVPRMARLTVSPSVGPQAGGTKVTVSTEDFFYDRQPFCRFGAHGVVPGKVLSPALLECVAPKQQEPCRHVGCIISVHVDSGHEAQQLNAVGATTFMYHPELHVARMWPTHGPSQGGTAVEVWGGGFEMGKRILCRFSHMTVAALVVDGNRVWCRAPPMSEGHSTLEVSTNGVDFTNQGSVYKYVAVGVLQTKPSFGPISGGTDVVLLGHHLVPGHLACKVGESTNTIKAHFESTSVASIRMAGGIGLHRAKVELVGVDGELHSSGSFTFVSALQGDISPLCGPLRGGTRLTISGAEHGMDLFCHFATAATGRPGILRWVGPNRRVCVTPAWPIAELTSVRTALAPGVFTGSSSATFKYVDEPRLHRMHPSTGSDKGGTIIVLQTSNLASVCHGTQLRCLFNRTEVLATVESPVQIICSAPAHMAGFVRIGVTFGSSTLDMNSQLLFQFVDSPLPRLTPAHGPTQGQTAICVRGMPTSSAAWCVFGNLATQGAPCSHCAFQSATCCSLPPRTRPSAVGVRLALHGVTTPAHSFRYIDAIVHIVDPIIGPSEGGTLVTVHGHNFDQVGRAFCAFGAHLRVARVVSRSRLTCHSPVGREDRRLQIIISGHSLGDGHTFAYFRPSTLRSGPSPSSSPVTGGTIITTTLGKLPAMPVGSLRCVFGHTHVMAIFDGLKIACASPAYEPGRVAFEMASVGHAMQHPEARTTFDYRSFRVPVLRPTAGPIRGGTLLVVSGGRWESSEILGCSFGGAYTSAQLLAPTRLACFSPEAVQQGMTILTVWLDGAVLHRLQFWQHEEPSIKRMHPLAGPNQGGTSITLAGRNFQRRAARCRFGDITVVAAWEVGPSILSCTVPAGETGLHRLELTFNGLDFAPARGFDMHPQLRVYASAPHCGPVDGGTRLIVDVGRALRSERALCRFEGTAVLAVVTNSTIIECRTPGHSAGYKTLDLSTNLQDFDSTGVLFQYVATRSPLSVSPSSGPHNGGTLLTISMHMQCLRQVWCLFGENRTPQLARQQSTSYLTCVTPRQEGPAVTMLRVMVEGDANSPLLLYQYQASVIIDGLHPPIGTTDGATRVEIIGRNFRHGADIRCAFNAVHVSPQWLSPQSMACIAPPAPVGAVPLQLVDLQGNALTQNAAPFQYSTRPVLDALLPAFGTSQGGTLISVRGAHFLRQAATMSLFACKFNATVVPASFVDVGIAQCVSPAHAVGSVFVALSNNRQDFSVQEITFHYGVHVSHVSFQTRRQPGSTLVDLRSQVGFVSSQLTCVLGGQETLASSITPSWIRCATPSLTRTGPLSHDVHGQRLITGTHVADLMAVVPPTGPSAGGQVVAVFGRGFRNGPQLRCSFGGVVVRAEFVSSEVINCTSPARGVGEVQRVEVTLYGGAFSASELWYEYRLSARITAFGTPSSGSTSVVVLGRRLSSQISCESISTGLHPIWVGSNEVLCSPEARDNGQAKLGGVHANVDADAQQGAAPFITALVPSEGPELGGTVVTLSGGNFPRTVGCVFGSMRPVLAQWQASARITCVTPPHDPSGVTLQVLTPTGQTAHESWRFKYTAMCSVLSVVPSRGTSSGGYRLVVSGQRFIDRVLTVHFGRQTVMGTLIDQSTVECIAPPSAGGPVLVELDFALQGRCRGGVPFVFENVTVLSVYPPFGPENGGTTLIIQGGNFGTLSDATCILSRGLRSVARVASTSRLECTAPPSAIGVVTLSISTGGHLSLAASSFEYQAAATVSTLLPSRGGTRGGTIVAVQGRHFSERSAHLFLIGCRFNLTLAVATFSAATALLCESPSVRMTGDVSLEMANNMADFTADGYLFEYVSALLVSRVAPTHGPVHGGTRLSLFGSHFDRNGRVLCRFAGATADASFQSPGQLTCLTPAKTVEGDTVSIILDGIGAQGQHRFSYYTPPVVSALVPPCGPRWGGTQITVRGAYLPMGRTVVCRFDDVLVPAVAITSELLNCTAPAHAPGLVKVEVSGDGLGTSSSTATFYYHDVVELGSLQPAMVAAGGVAVLRVTGRNILPGSACLLEGQEGASGYHVWISSSELLCNVVMPTAAGEYMISVSVNMQQATREAVAIRVVEPWQVEDIEPGSGPVHGGTVIRITGGRFPPGPQLLCRIGSGIPVAARWLSAAHVACVTRPHPPGLAAVGVTGNGQDYSEGVARFEYVAAAAVLALSPRHGPVGGGTLVALRGGPFSARAGALGRMLCRFGRSLSAARLVSGHVTECVSPPHSPAEVHVQLTMNGLDFTQDDVRFSYRGPTILSMHPTLGPELGGTLLTVDGADMSREASLACHFGRSGASPALWISRSRVRCVTPARPPGVVALGVASTIGSAAAAAATEHLAFEYQAAAVVRSVTPSAGPVLGGTPVTLIGAHFSSRSADLSYLLCRFNETTSQAVWRNSSVLVCAVPAVAGLSAGASLPRIVAVQVSNNVVDFSGSAAHFQYLAAARLAGLRPTAGPRSGGSLVTLMGSDFARAPMRCHFGQVDVVSSYVATHTVQCIAPPSGAGTWSRVLVRLSVDGDVVSAAAGRVHFVYQDEPAIRLVSPTTGPEEGHTRVSVLGSGFASTASLKCRFGSVVVDALFVSDGMVNCTTPTHLPGLVAMEVSLDALHFSASNASFVYHATATVLAIAPSVGPTRGGTNVSLTGRGLLQGSTCSFGGYAAVRAIWVSQFEVVCVTPPRPSGLHALMLTSSALETEGRAAATFAYLPPIEPVHIEPLLGPIAGGTVIRITGGRFPPGPQLLCRIGSGIPVAARWLSAAHVACVTRPHPPGLAAVGVTGNGQDYSEGVARFEYVAAAAVLALSPRHGPVGGGTLVALRGGPFSARAGALGRMLCRFGRSLSAARLVSGHVTECVSPPHSPAEVHVQLTMNGLDFTQDDVRFSYRGPTILSMHPTLGPELGGTPVLLRVTFIPATSSLQCRFGLSTPAVASPLNSTHILCASPLHAIGIINVRLSTGGREWPDLRGPSFEFHGQVQIHHLVPSMGSALGGDLITIIGANFVDGGVGMRCRFGDASSLAALVNASAIACMTPRQPAAVAPVEVSINGHDFTESRAEFVFTGWSIHSVSPRLGPTAGGTLVTVEMQGMAHSSAEYMCRFGSAQLVSAARLPRGALQCLSPAQPAVSVAFEVIAMGVEEARATATFDYFEEPRVVHAFPRRVFQNGVPLIYIQGTQFFNSTSLTCAFGLVRTNATFVNNHSVACIAPHTSETGLHHAEVQVRVSMNGQDYTSTMVAIDVVACPNGASCLATQSLPCAPGAQCIGQLGSNQTQCPAGTYQPEGGRSGCVPCTRGSFCPAPGRSAPKQCVAGMVCSLQGLAFPDRLCPPGHFCPPGVQTSNPESQLHLERPLACPENTWCAAGVATNISEVGNFRTPQPCLSGFVCFRGSASPQGSGPCPTGYYCPPNSLPIACTYANYCPGVGNIFPSQCTPGFYNDRRGRNACIECPIGHICPLAGLKHPAICPAGSVCNVPGLKVPAGLCPAGYLCWEGTETKDWNAETVFKPIPCKEATYCLGGITNNITNENDYASPQPCPHGHYCKEASTTPFGTGRCPAGFFCPKGTSDPFPAPAGYFCKGEGNAMAAPCLPGTWAKYNPHNGTDTCDMCPAGYSCEREGTFAPRPCLPGSYRQFNATISCQLCPEGSWNPFYTNPLESLCLPCPEGRVCPVKGMTNVTQSIACPEGYICGFNTTANSQFSTLCPQGYWCDFETKNIHKACAADKATQVARAEISRQMEGPDDDICDCLDTCGRIEREDYDAAAPIGATKRCYCPMGPCPAGSLCHSGTKRSQWDRTPCPAGYYCPEGTSPADLFELGRFKCPNGTISGLGKERVTDCERSGLYVTNAISRDMFGSGKPLYAILSEAEFSEQHSDALEEDPYKNSRYGDPRFAAQASRGERRALRQLQEEPEMLQYLTEPPELVTFKLSPFTMARFTFDYLKVPTEMIYDDHFRIAIFVNGHTQPEPYPPSFWFNPPATSVNPLYPEYKEYRWSKSGIFALHLHALRELNFRVELQILHGLFSDSIDAFVGTMALEIFDSTRANTLSMSVDGVRKMLFAAVKKDGTFAPPLNLPRIRPDPRHYPGATYLLPHMQENLAAVLEYAALNESAEVLLDPLEGKYSVALSGDDYWGTRLMVAPMNYLPYFSHCSGGVRIGAPSSGDFHEDKDKAFSIGNRATGPARRRGDLVKCNCRGRAVWFPECPPPEGASKYNPGDCSPAAVDASGKSQGEIAFKIKQFPNIGANSPRDDQLLLNGEFVVPDGCADCEAVGSAPGTPYPNIRPERVPGWDSHGLFFWVYENPGACELVPPEDTIPISQFTWGAVTRFSDTCDYIMQCMYEENTVIKLDKPFWFNGMQDDIIFYLTSDPARTSLVEEGFCFPDTPADKGRNCKGNAYFLKVQTMLENQVLRFMKVKRDMKEPMNWFPLRVHFELRYWQKDTMTKTVINGNVNLEDFTPLDDYYSPEHAANPYDVQDVSNTWGLRGFQYDLRMTLVPVDWMEVLNTFALNIGTYVIFYFVCDAAMVVLVMMLWAFFRGTTKHTSPPKLHLKEWFKGFELNPVKGMLMIFWPIAFCCMIILFVLRGMNPIKGLVAGDLNFEGTITDAIEIRWMEGRIGICVLALGFNLMQNGASLLCPRKDKPGSVWLPGYWQRRHILYTSAMLFVMLLMVLEFSFSRFFAQNALVFMMLFKVVWIYMESWLLKALNEKLIALPFECALQTAQFVMTLGAEGFISFITSFVVELLIMIVKRVAMDPIKFKVVRTAKLKVKIAQAQKLGQPVPVHTPELEAIGVMIDMLQSMYRFSVDSLGTVISPMSIAVLYLFRKEYEISSLYGIRDTDLLYYMLFSIIMIPALWFVDIFLHNTLELVWNWKLYEYIEFCTERFRNRTRRWVGLDTAINEELPSDLRTLDQMCFSTQFYFLGALHASGIVMAVLGYMLVLHKGHNM